MQSKTSHFLLCLGSLLLIVAPAFAQPVPSAVSDTPPPAPVEGTTLLLDQVSNCDTFGSTSQFFTDFAGGSDLADDFTVPAEMQWTITEINTPGFYTALGTTTTVNVRVWDNTGPSGLPGNLVCDYAGVTVASGGGDGNYVVDLSGTPCIVGEGTYWASVQAIMAFAGADQWFWFNSFDNNNDPKAFQDVSDLFGTGCTSWDFADNCLTPNPNGANDLCFSLSGTEEVVQPEDPLAIPTLGQVGLAALLLGLIGAGLFALRRRG